VTVEQQIRWALGLVLAVILVIVGISYWNTVELTKSEQLVQHTQEVGKEIELDFAAGGLIPGRVVWTKGTQFGVQFREKFNLKLLQQVAKPTPKGAKFMTPDYMKSDASAAK